MAGTEQDFPRSEHQFQQAPTNPDALRREAWQRITSGVGQLFAAIAADTVRLLRWLVPSRRSVVFLMKTALFAAIVLFLGVATVMLWALRDAPLERPGAISTPSLLVEAANGEPLGRIGSFGDAVRRQDFPDILINAVISIEDRRFYSHHGIDLRGIARASYANWTAGNVVEGGSTITQQLAKLLIVGSERTMTRKLREACTAIWLELRLEKDAILTRYLNTVYLGAGMHGMSAASRMYFDKNVSELTLPEAAMLAGLIQAPSKFNPLRDLEAAHRRAANVIDAMLETGTIDAASAREAKAHPAALRLSPRTVRAGSWFADWIAKYEVPKIAGSGNRALRVRTSLQPRLQQLAERVVNEALSGPEGGRGAGQAALVAMRPNGAVVAMVGGRNYEQSEFNRAADALRQPGSTFKLFVYYAALRKGYSPEDMIDASPVEMGRWEPENYGGQEYGDVTLARAFAGSINSAAIRLAQTVGLDEVVAAARELGLDAPLVKVPSMALGTNEVSLLDLTGAFASVRAAHPRIEPWGITAIGQEGSGLRSLGPPIVSAQPLPHDEEMIQLLRGVVEHGTGRAARLDRGEAAGKTGTSQDYRDAWFVGFNEALVVGVWVGNDDRTPMEGVTGGSLPAQIWKRFVSAATPLLDKPGGALSAGNAPFGFDANAATSSAGNSMASSPRAQCDLDACAARYSSFNPSDCTYRSYAGPRRLCEMAPSGGDVLQPTADLLPTSARSASCDVNRCSRRYRSFDESDCTYQPYDGGARQRCDMGDQAE